MRLLAAARSMVIGVAAVTFVVAGSSIVDSFLVGDSAQEKMRRLIANICKVTRRIIDRFCRE